MTNSALKFTGQFQQGDLVKALDFPSRDDCFVLGFVEDTDCWMQGVRCFRVKAFDVVFGGEVVPEGKGQEFFVPHETMMDELFTQDRVSLVEAAQNIAR